MLVESWLVLMWTSLTTIITIDHILCIISQLLFRQVVFSIMALITRWSFCAALMLIKRLNLLWGNNIIATKRQLMDRILRGIYPAIVIGIVMVFNQTGHGTPLRMRDHASFYIRPFPSNNNQMRWLCSFAEMRFVKYTN
jgi:hypothetical protein